MTMMPMLTTTGRTGITTADTMNMKGMIQITIPSRIPTITARSPNRHPMTATTIPTGPATGTAAGIPAMTMTTISVTGTQISRTGILTGKTEKNSSSDEFLFCPVFI